MHIFAISACRSLESISPSVFPLAFPPIIGRRAVYVSLYSEERHEKQMGLKIEIKTDAFLSSQSYCKDLVRVVEILDIPL